MTNKKFYKKGSKPESTQCYRCGGYHNPDDCKFKNAQCHVCNKNGHIKARCRSNSYQNKVAYVDENEDKEDILGIYSVFKA